MILFKDNPHVQKHKILFEMFGPESKKRSQYSVYTHGERKREALRAKFAAPSLGLLLIFAAYVIGFDVYEGDREQAIKKAERTVSTNELLLTVNDSDYSSDFLNDTELRFADDLNEFLALPETEVCNPEDSNALLTRLGDTWPERATLEYYPEARMLSYNNEQLARRVQLACNNELDQALYAPVEIPDEPIRMPFVSSSMLLVAIAGTLAFIVALPVIYSLIVSFFLGAIYSPIMSNRERSQQKKQASTLRQRFAASPYLHAYESLLEAKESAESGRDTSRLSSMELTLMQKLQTFESQQSNTATSQDEVFFEELSAETDRTIDETAALEQARAEVDATTAVVDADLDMMREKDLDRLNELIDRL